MVQLSGETRKDANDKLASASIEQADDSSKKADEQLREASQVPKTRLEVVVGPPSEPEPQTGFVTGISQQGSKKQSTANDLPHGHDPTDSGIRIPKSVESSREEHVTVEPRPTTTIDTHDARILKPPTKDNAPPRKMDGSQQTPTQANEDRDYAELPDSLPSPGRAPKPNTEEQEHERTLDPDDTGAVDFGILSEFARPSSQVSEDGGFENTRGGWSTTQQYSGPAYTPFKPNGVAPETPAVPRNPFGAKPNVAAPFAASQLFGQTQFSSAMKPNAISPTSSRPSPNIVHNSISPNVAETSPLKNRANISSPTDVRSSSPDRVDDVPATVCKLPKLDRIEEETPSHVRSMREEAIPQSPSHPPPKSSGSRQPLARYESVKKSQERKTQLDFSYTFVGSDSDDDPITRQVARRKRVEKKKAQAAQEMERVNYMPRSRPSSRGKPEKKRRRTTPEDETNITHVALSKSVEPLKGSSEQPLVVADSQQREDSSAQRTVGDGTTQGTAEPGPEPEPEPMQTDEAAVDAVQEQLDLDDKIPATSPAPSSSPDAGLDAIPQSEPDLPQLTNEAPKTSNSTGTSSMPPVRHRSLMQYGKQSRAPRRIITSSASELPSKQTGISSDRPSSPSSPASTAIMEDEPPKEWESDAVTPLNQHNRKKGGSSSRKSTKTSSSRKSTRSKIKRPPAKAVAEEPPSALDPDSSVSSLSSVPESALCTPSGLREETPIYDGPPSTAASQNMPLSGSRQSLRQRAMKAEGSSLSPQATMRYARAAKSHAPFYGSQSTDELAMSPPNSVMEKSMVQPKSTKIFRASLAPVSKGGRIFEGMAFALSFLSNRSKERDREKLATRIKQAGATILEDGFEELFETSPIISTTETLLDVDEPMALAKAWGEVGFTALIADSHSRKPKYMQALAVGLPCLAPQWITACLSKGRVLDWEPYLLCSGASAVLDNALRSRQLAPYSTHDVRLAEVVDQRRKLLENQRILIVVASKNGRSEVKQPYVFLTQALGPVASRVFTTEQARDTLKQHARDGQPFDWIYVDTKGTGLVESILPDLTKKRKRNSSGGVRVLNDELIIQSLILGRMLEEDEICF